MLSHYIVLGEMRNKSKAIQFGDFKPIFSGNHTIAYERNYKGEKVIVIVNRGIFFDEGEHIELNVDGKEAVSLIGDEKITISDNKLVVDLTPLGYKVFKIQN